MQRDAYFDNAKWILMFFVVFGHTIQPFVENHQTVYVIYQWIYFFHMPAFIFLAGYFAKPSGTNGYFMKLVKKLLLPYVIFQAIYTIYYFGIGKQDWLNAPYEPHWSLWFLVSLLSWHVLLYYFKRLPKHVAFMITIQLGLLVGYIDVIGHNFSLSRTFVFFPFFLLGYWFGPEQISWLKQTKIKAISLGVLAAAAVAVALSPEFSISWLLGSKSYLQMGAPEWGGFFRLAVYIVSLLMVFSVLAWLPNREFNWTKYGSKTLYVYLLHGFFIHFFREFHVFELNTFLDAVLIVAVPLALTWFLATTPVVRMAKPLIEWKRSYFVWIKKNVGLVKE